MQKTIGTIWDLAESHFLVIPVNSGYRRDGTSIMGRGLALQAAKRFPELPAFYGNICRADGGGTSFVVYGDRRLILFPVKPLIREAPHLSWNQPADLDCIKASCQNLVDWMAAFQAEFDLPELPLVAMPMIGCGNGKLKPEAVMPILEHYFGEHDNVVLVTQGS